jgi:hypothetical protein
MAATLCELADIGRGRHPLEVERFDAAFEPI